jgi:two-component system cell cycle response regulator
MPNTDDHGWATPDPTLRIELHPPTRRPASAPLLVHIYPPGPGLGACFPLTAPAHVIGRDEACNIVVAHHSVSRNHARVEAEPDGYYAVDLQSTNGTYVNDTPISRARLNEGDYLRVGVCIFRFLASSNIEAQYHEEIHRLTILDGLTGTANKRHLLDFLERELARTLRHRRPLSLILFDIDHFKTVNDTLGHLAGDFVLRELAACVRDEVRREELFARYGGEEFVLVLPEAATATAVPAAERIRQKVEGHAFHYEEHALHVTISAGIAATSGETPLTPVELIGRADARLYEAKQQGRNRVVSG